MVIISFILTIFLNDSTIFLLGEIRCWSLLGFKRLSDQSLKEEENRNRLLRLSQRWPPLHNGGEGLTVVKITVIMGKQIWDFEDWLLYTGWLLNSLLLNIGPTAFVVQLLWKWQTLTNCSEDVLTKLPVPDTTSNTLSLLWCSRMYLSYRIQN